MKQRKVKTLPNQVKSMSNQTNLNDTLIKLVVDIERSKKAHTAQGKYNFWQVRSFYT